MRKVVYLILCTGGILWLFSNKKIVKMTLDDWKKVKHFKMADKWGNPFQMAVKLVHRLELLWELAKTNIVLHCGYATTGHAPDSYHYKGMAVDLHIKGKTLRQQYEIAQAAGFTGIGLYPYWNNPGLHVDIRPGWKKIYWYRDKWGQYHYNFDLKLLDSLEV